MMLLKLLLTIFGIFHHGKGQTYGDALALQEYLKGLQYCVTVRPLLNQSHIMKVDARFYLLSIIEVNDVSQSFKWKGFVKLVWGDELLVWNVSEYGVHDTVPPMSEIWKPRLMLLNTLGKRNVFGDDMALIRLSSTGEVAWTRGSVFTVSCSLDMTNYPFDEQSCTVEVSIMDHMGQITFIVRPTSTEKYKNNGEWDLIKIVEKVTTQQIIKVITFHMKRKAAAFLLNVLVPVVILSFLNLLVFLIPADSGERIGYDITVSLALVLSMTFVSEMLPSSSEHLPKVTIYMFALLVLSFLTVIMSIIIVFFNHLQEKETVHQKPKDEFQRVVKKLSNIRNVVTTLKNRKSDPGHEQDNQPEEEQGNNNENDDFRQPRKNKYKTVGKYIDITSFVVCLLAWLGLTFGYILSMTF